MGQVRAVIADFGLSRATDPATEDRLTGSMPGILGTPDYMAPEQVEGGQITPATDVYALGIVLYEMVSWGAASRRIRRWRGVS